ncbi:MAG TPA: TRAP transporter large permease [Azoarcus taiwanensis]|uniref:TRAP transporter large permease protein n=1 Tax=Azoarcus taiwanensis TaxID=666964 RepID=A0A972F910_9RHOO|nr:TRAP transporter large permease [Azoarcus taiwanensis]NMG04459.1 TRAP transporter large permease subunit [Azoarcus taiwanensis]HRQ57228.1 TRAP transporter large permease [Azoarcus taiwanensis]
MTSLEIAIWSFVILLLLIFGRMPIGLAMLLCGLVGSYTIFGNWMPVLAGLKSHAYDTFGNYSLSVVPLFLLMGAFAMKGGLSTALFKAASAWLGHRKGGVAMAAVGASAGFGAICGSSLATAATMGRVALPELKRHGYSGAMSTGALAAGGTLGILIPPSIVLVIYAILTEQNIAKLFIAAMIPGVLAALGYMLTIAIQVRLDPRDAMQTERLSYWTRFKALGEIWPVVLIFVVMIGGMNTGVFTPTEGAAVGAAGTGLVAALRGRLGWRDLVDCFRSTAVSTAMIFFIVLGASSYNAFLAVARLPVAAADWVGSLGVAPLLVLLVILLIYLLFGCVMDSLSMILLTVPIFFPVIMSLDFGLSPEETALWFGVLVLIVVEVGLITPPVGMNLFIINSMSGGVPMSQTYRGVLPFVASDMIRTLILVIFPSITLWLVWVMF